MQRLAKLAEQHNAHIVMFNAYKEEFQESPEMKGLLVRCQDLIKEKQIEEAQEELTFEQVLADEDHIPTFITKKPIGMVLPAVPGPNEYYADDEGHVKAPGSKNRPR